MSGWDGLLGVLRDIGRDSTRVLSQPGTDCPRCGHSLEPVARAGGLHCPFDGWQGSAQQARERGPLHVPTVPPDLYLATYTSTY